MVNLTINQTPVAVEEGATILDAARQLGISIPTLCYFEGLSDIGACRVCCVEVAGEERLVAACNTVVSEGMEVITDSERAERMRKANLELMLSRHDLNCDICDRNGTCRLQYLLRRYGLIDEFNLEEPCSFAKSLRTGKRAAWDKDLPIQRDANKCISCGRCVMTCSKIQDIGVWEFTGTGANAGIGVRNRSTMPEQNCVACGQCITHCPDAALTERDDTLKLRAALADPEITTVIQIAPATRTAWATSFGLKDGEAGVERMAAALKAMGADYVFDTTFSADLTIMEEGTELLNIIKSGQTQRLPLFTSCCPGWVNHAKNASAAAYAHLSSAKSPMQMFGAVVKTWFAQQKGLDPEKIFSVALMPCTAKKNEINLPGMSANPGVPDMDASLTTREFARMVANAGLDPRTLEDVALDDPLGEGTGAGVIFGTTGGVMEAALRTADFLMTGEKHDPDGFVFHDSELGPWKEATFDMGGVAVNCAVVSGLANTNKLLAKWEAGELEHYHFIEVMACPSGCAGGGGQPIDGSDRELGLKRGEVLHHLDKESLPLRFSHENPTIVKLYDEFFGAPNSELAEELLHVHYYK